MPALPVDLHLRAETLPILYRDEHLVAVDKPAGLLVHRTGIDAHETRFALQILRRQLGQRVYPVHRLDKGTSGVLLFALDPGTSRAIQARFESRDVEKTYVAVVRGHPPDAGCIDHPLAPIIESKATDTDTETTPQPALTRFRRLATAEVPVRVDRYPTSRYALIELHPESGRRHQLRRHLKHISHPIIGDATYGNGRHNRMFADLFACKRMLLASTRLMLTHPVTGESLDLRAPLAEDFAAVLRQLNLTWTARN